MAPGPIPGMPPSRHQEAGEAMPAFGGAHPAGPGRPAVGDGGRLRVGGQPRRGLLRLRTVILGATGGKRLFLILRGGQ
ncbi:hypothetical protein QJS66_05230 [Kocuria rhizophila]|nr:hypothetical protein QJS66_05230 [Kocuria rhizophila]